VPTTPELCYFICCTQRSGSYLLCEALENTGLAGRPGETLPASMEPWHEGFTLDNYRAAFGAAFSRWTSGGIFGAKLMWPWFEDFTTKLEILARRTGTPVPELIGQIFPNPHYIMLTRRDKVRQTISLAKGDWTRIWRSTDKQQPKRPIEELRIDPRVIDTEMRITIEHETSFQRYFQRHQIPLFPVVYEELVDRYEETALEILDFLGISHPPDLVFGPRKLEKQWDAASDELLRQYYAAKGMTPVRDSSPGRR